MIEIKFETIDRWNRPVFRNIKSKSRYGSLDKLFPFDESEDEVLKHVKAEDLCFFGNSYDCEPNGNKPIEPIKILRNGNYE